MYLILGQLFALITAMCWAQNSLIYASLGKKVGSDAVTHVRLWLAFPIMVILNYAITGFFLPQGLNTVNFTYIFISGFLGFFIADLFLFRAFVELGAREAMVIMTTSPVFSLFFSWIFIKESISIVKILGIFIILGAVIWVIIEENKNQAKDHKINFKGIFYALLGSLSQSLGVIFAKKAMMEGIHPVSTNLIRICAGLSGLFIYSLLRKRVKKDFVSFKNRKYFLMLLFAVLVGPVLGIVLSLYALNWAPVGIVTTLMQVSPILLLPIDIFVFKKRVSLGAVFATVIAVFGASLLFLF